MTNTNNQAQEKNATWIVSEIIREEQNCLHWKNVQGEQVDKKILIISYYLDKYNTRKPK